MQVMIIACTATRPVEIMQHPDCNLPSDSITMARIFSSSQDTCGDGIAVAGGVSTARGWGLHGPELDAGFDNSWGWRPPTKQEYSHCCMMHCGLTTCTHVPSMAGPAIACVGFTQSTPARPLHTGNLGSFSRSYLASSQPLCHNIQQMGLVLYVLSYWYTRPPDKVARMSMLVVNITAGCTWGLKMLSVETVNLTMLTPGLAWTTVRNGHDHAWVLGPVWNQSQLDSPGPTAAGT